MTDSDDVTVLVPATKIVRAGGEELTIEPMRARQIVRVLAVGSGLVDSIMAARREAGEEAEDMELDLAQLATRHGEQLIDVLAVATHKESDWVGELMGDELLRLAGAVISINADFFFQHMLPAFQEAMAEATARLDAEDSAMSSSG